MSIKIINSLEATAPKLVMCIYGQGGVGKSTLAATAPKPIFIDAEDGTKAFGARGIKVDIAKVSSWSDVQEAWKLIASSKDYETLVIDPVGAFLDLLVAEISRGMDMNLKKWGEVKDRMRKFIWMVKNSGKHVIFVAHEDKKVDEEMQIRSPKLAANLSDELVNLCDVVGHFRIEKDGRRAILVQPEMKYVAKDRFDVLGTTIHSPDVSLMIAKIHDVYNKPPFEDKQPIT